MEAILPFKIKNEQKFISNALKVGYNELEILKFIYVMQQSDMDIFPIMHDERINMLLYGWELCEDYKQKLSPNEWELPEELETILKLFVPWSLDIWFSKEWDKCKYLLKSALIHCLNRARDLLMRMPDMMQINWDFLLLYNLKPWNVLYLKNLTVTKEKTLENGAQSIETEESSATDEDIAYVKLEQLPIIVLRLVKLFDQSSIDMVKTLCMRVIAAWNKIHQTELETSGSRRPYIPPEDKRCLLLICHIYLMSVYESDDVKGYVIDNMINNVRFYYQGFQNSAAFHVMDNFEFTPARYIALTNFHLRVQKRDFFDFFIWNKYDTSLVNLFGVVSQAYKSYLLGNLLMELNNMNEDDFASNIPLYKRLMNSYVNEREKSEIFLLSELTKIEHQRFAHNIIQTIKNITDYESKICKGNRMSNIGNYENSDDTVAPLADSKTQHNSSEIKTEDIKEDIIDEDIELEQKRVKESELRLDPVFQNLPNNESMLYYVYDVLAKKDYKGWHFAKVVLLVKLIGHEQNMVETWRYHPGLTTDFMLNLELKLSHHYVDLAKIFKDHPFIEQEFWLTAFYLNPTSELYEIVKRLGMRNNRKRTEEHTKLVMSIDNIEAKYGLLSSTIDVKELATMSNTDDPNTDYDPLFCALHSLRVPDSLIKDMLTAIFLPRNRSFAWAVDWVVLRNRCKMIMTSSKEKKRFVDLNMAEANERLKFLIIDYKKYKNRPQLDYGTIEQGYENLMTREEFDNDSSEEEEDEEEDFEDDEDVYESKKRGRGRPSGATKKKEEEEKVEDDNSQEDDPFLMGKRRTRARTAATLASFLFQTLPRSSRRKRNQKPSEEETKTEEEKVSAENDDRSSDSKSPITTSETLTPFPVTENCDQIENKIVNVSTKNLKECLKDRPTFLNTTQGFQNVVDIWNVKITELKSIDKNCVSLMESSAALQIAAKLKSLNKEINPNDCDELEFIDATEMMIYNAGYAIKMECEVKNEPTLQMITKTCNLDESLEPMEVDNHKEIVSEIEHGTIGTNQSKILTPLAEDNSRESVNSKLSIAALKNSGQVSEPNSKRNSLNIDIEKVIQNDDLSDQEEPRKKLLKTLQGNQETENYQNENCQGFVKTSYKKELQGKNKENPHLDEEHKEKECTEGNKDIEAGKEMEVGNEGNAENKAVEKNAKNFEEKVKSDVEGDNNQEQDKETNKEYEMTTKNKTLDVKNIGNENKGAEIKLDDKIEKEKISVNKTKVAVGIEKKNNVEKNQAISEAPKSTEEHEEKHENVQESEVVQGNKEQETKKLNAMEKLESLEVNKELNKSKTKQMYEVTKEQDLEELKEEEGNETDKDNESKTYNKFTIVPESATRQDKNKDGIKNNKIAMEDEQKSVSDDTNTQDFEKSSSNVELKKPATNLTQTETKVSDNKQIEVKIDSKKDLKTSQQNDDLQNTENTQNHTCLKGKVESTDLIIEKKLDIKEDNAAVDKGSLDCSEMQESNIILHYLAHEATNDEIVTKNPKDSKVNQEIPNSAEYKNASETLKNQTKHAHGHKGKDEPDVDIEINIMENERTTVVSSEQNKLETVISTKAEVTSNYQASDNKNDLSNPITLQATNEDKYFRSPFNVLEDNSVDSVQSSESTDFETRELKDLCLRKNVKVLLRKLRPSDLIDLRQPKVKVQRMSYENYLLNFRPKRKRFDEKIYLEFDESSNSCFANSSSSEAYHPPRIKKIPMRRHSLRQARTSDSENDSINSEDVKLSTIISKKCNRHLSPLSTSQSSTSRHVTGPKSARKSGPKSTRKKTGPKSSKAKQNNLVVTPRSASGLKLRISNAERNRKLTGPKSKKSKIIPTEEIIQLSSTSSDEYLWNELTAIEEEVIEIEENPLFEEEIII